MLELLPVNSGFQSHLKGAGTGSRKCGKEENPFGPSAMDRRADIRPLLAVTGSIDFRLAGRTIACLLSNIFIRWICMRITLDGSYSEMPLCS